MQKKDRLICLVTWLNMDLALSTRIAEQCKVIVGCDDYVDYCRLRDMGLRKQAFQSLEKFMVCAKSWTFERRRNFAEQMMIISSESEFSIHDFIPYPLLMTIILPTIREWAGNEPNATLPFRYLYSLHEPGALQRILEIDPSDVQANVSLAYHHLGDVEFAQHHLHESKFLGRIEEVSESLEKALHIIDSLPDGNKKNRLKQDYEKDKSILEDWIQYSKSPTGDFPKWCEQHRRDYGWGRTYYYGK